MRATDFRSTGFASAAARRTALAALCAAGLATGLSAAGCGGAGAVHIAGAVDRGEAVMAGVPEVRPAVRERMLQFLNARSAAFVDAEDGAQPMASVLIRTRFGNAAQLHRVTTPGGARTQVTFYDEPVGAAAFVPGSGGRQIILLRDAGGSEDYQVYLLDLSSGRTRMLTSGKGQHGALVLTHDGTKAAFYGTGRNGRDYDTYVVELSGEMTPKMVYSGKGAVSPLGFSPDGGKLLLGEFKSASQSAVLVLDVASGQATPLTPPDEKAANGDATYSADGRFVFYTSDRGGEFRRLVRHEVATRKEEVITAALPWDVEGVAVSPSGSAVVFVTNEDGAARLYRLDAVDGVGYSPVPLPGTGQVSGLGFNRAGTHLCYSFGTATMPGDVFTQPVAELGGGPATRWTSSELGGLDESKLVTPTRISFATFDTVDGSPRMIPAYYFRPAGAGPFPAVIMIHGGPEAQYRPGFSGFLQYLASEMQVAVIAPNVRGSTGYGRSYHQLDDAEKREDAVKDIGQLIVWIKLQKELDPERIAVYGGSYGGYMVLACLTHYSQFLRAGIDVVGIANFVSFLERTRDYRRDLRRREYGDEQDPKMREVLVRISPLNNAEKIRSALFVLHGENDPRVPLYEAQQIVRRQQAQKRPVWFMMAKGEGHGFRKRTNSDLSQVLQAMFLEEYLVKGSQVAPK
ncbi:MAG: alpha/beta fold hydrolase [Phycisphaerae bacterium]